MNKTFAGLGLLLALSMFCTVQAGAQQPETEKKESKTKLEAFIAKTGAVIIKGYTFSGMITALGKVEVDAMEFQDASTGNKQSGIRIEVKESGRFEKSDSSFIDYDEIDSLLKGIEYVSKVTHASTKLENFEATYKTKGDFKVITYSSSGDIKAAVKSGYIGSATAFVSLEQLGALRSIIILAKQKLDAAK